MDESSESGPPAGWFADPHGRAQLRWWDGQRWTDTVADHGQTHTEGVAPPPPPVSPFPPPAATAPPARGSRRGVLVALAVATVVAVAAGAIVVLGGDDDEGDVAASDTSDDGDTSDETTDEDNGGVIRVEQTITASGGEIKAEVPDVGDVGVNLPAGSVGQPVDVELSVTMRPVASFVDLAADDSAIWDAVAEHAVAADESLLHPLYGPALLAQLGQTASIAVGLEPDGTPLSTPGEITVPIGVADPDDADTLLVLVRTEGRWEVIEGVVVDRAAGTMAFPIAHFSEHVIIRIAGNFLSNPLAHVALTDFRTALQTLGNGPLNGQMDGIVRAALCGPSTSFDASAIPALEDVVNYLGFESSRISTAPAGAGNRIRDALRTIADDARNAGTPDPRNVSLETVVAMAMIETGNDVFQALVLAHDVLRDNREDPRVQGVLANVRGDAGGDERGGRYHLLGMAVYAFAYENQRATSGTPWWPPPPEVTAQIEEAWVSGDIRTDPIEYALDRRGAGLGRRILSGYQLGESERQALCAEIAVPTTTTTTTTTTVTPSTAPPDLGSGDVQVTLLWAGDSDMDLHVVDPGGEEIFFSSTTSTSGGQLDRDDIPSCGETGDHAENIFWPTGGAPTGEYEAYVHYFGGCGVTAQSVQITVRVGGAIVSQQSFSLAEDATSDIVRFSVG